MVVDYLSSQPNRAGYQVSTKQGSGPCSTAAAGADWHHRLHRRIAKRQEATKRATPRLDVHRRLDYLNYRINLVRCFLGLLVYAHWLDDDA